ncbi:MAG TPA: c-type cytochrome, partial [Stellaceae bacterium]|nr:c-type cytochrome [Stellaceae bacterium]
MRIAAGLALVVGLMMGMGQAMAGGDAAAGKAVFAKCATCHSLEDGNNGIGPSLHGIFGRKAASADDFHYSPFMEKSGIVWDEVQLDKYLADPQGLV